METSDKNFLLKLVRFRDDEAIKSKETSSGLRRHNYQDFPKCISYHGHSGINPVLFTA